MGRRTWRRERPVAEKKNRHAPTDSVTADLRLLKDLLHRELEALQCKTTAEKLCVTRRAAVLSLTADAALARCSTRTARRLHTDVTALYMQIMQRAIVDKLKEEGVEAI